MPEHQTIPTLHDYLTVSQAASILGVCSATLRKWDRAGKLKPVRHPMNGYRLYRRDELDAVLRQLSHVVPNRSAQVSE